MSECIFCQIVKGQIPSKRVYEDEEVVAFHDIAPKAPIHVLIIPRKHIPTLADVTEEDLPLIAAIHRGALAVARELGLQENGFRLVNNCKKDGGQEVYHLHYHLLGGAPLAMHFGQR
ncbi:MAG: histidine triad nucleotide-binding protein [Bacillus thermozeamaize]|jgi:histidine triad (HIT) family protein|uniref:Histidine triad nucleotide-binding protein n=1 Tax=Bacillus thermozeamaize TaxID=230954 RepID=A0A1Y3PK71_9BACI|nr:MAG: histidine triad nucleotide-binding protein [Bacillus thermozeamaize]